MGFVTIFSLPYFFARDKIGIIDKKEGGDLSIIHNPHAFCVGAIDIDPWRDLRYTPAAFDRVDALDAVGLQTRDLSDN